MSRRNSPATSHTAGLLEGLKVGTSVSEVGRHKVVLLSLLVGKFLMDSGSWGRGCQNALDHTRVTQN